MKQVNTFSNKMFLLEDDKAEKLKEMMMSGQKAVVELDDGTILNIAAIESITFPDTEPYFLGNRMSKDETKVFVDGEWKKFCGQKSQIKYMPVAKTGKQPTDKQGIVVYDDV